MFAGFIIPVSALASHTQSRESIFSSSPILIFLPLINFLLLCERKKKQVWILNNYLLLHPNYPFYHHLHLLPLYHFSSQINFIFFKNQIFLSNFTLPLKNPNFWEPICVCFNRIHHMLVGPDLIKLCQ